MEPDAPEYTKVTIDIAPEILSNLLDTWSPPVQFQAIQSGNSYELVFRTCCVTNPGCEMSPRKDWPAMRPYVVPNSGEDA